MIVRAMDPWSRPLRLVPWLLLLASCGDDGGAGARDAALDGPTPRADSGPRPDASEPRDAASRPDVGPSDAATSSLVDRIADRGGVTWTFAEPVRAGQFVTGDWWVVGPATGSDPEKGADGVRAKCA